MLENPQIRINMSDVLTKIPSESLIA